MTLQATDLADLVTSTQNNLGRLQWTDLGTDKLDFLAFRQLINRYRVTFQSGPRIQWNVVVRNSGQAREVGLYETDSVNTTDVLKTAAIDWRHMEVPYQFDLREEAINSGDENRIVDLVQVRRNDAFTSLPELIENRFWSTPSSSSDDKRIFGLPYWIVWSDNSATNPTGGFDGGNPTGFSAGAGGLDSTVYTRWTNWCAKYADVTKTDLIRKMRKAATKTKFRPPVRSPSYGGVSRFGYYTNYTVLGQMEEILEAQNDNLGNNLASKDGEVLFRRVPVEYCDQLDARTGDPIYGIDWSTMNPVVLAGWYLREMQKPAANSHNVVQFFIDLSMNLRCTNRRQNFVIAASSDV